MTDEPGAPAPKWEILEFAAAAVLTAVAFVILGGLGGGIDIAATGPASSLQIVGSYITVGAAWAGPLLAVALLAVAGVAWWQVTGWSDVIDSGGDDADQEEAIGHLVRGYKLTRWNVVALLVTGVGAVAGFVGAVLLGHDVPFASGDVSRDILAAGNLLAVLVIITVGLLIARTSLIRVDNGSM
jgi:hypothetical protein